MKKTLFFFTIIIVSCSTPSVKNDILSVLELELSGEKLNDSIITYNKHIENDFFSSQIFYKSDIDLINEVDIHINTKNDSLYSVLSNYYNNLFSSNKTDTTINSWNTDSSEYILYKKSDSSILVNIFKRTYL